MDGSEMKQALTALFGIFLLCAAPAWAAQPYKYASRDAEYTVKLPAVPTVKTIWADDPKVPYLDSTPRNGQEIGETATFKRIDIQTNEVFDVQITFLKANKDFLSTLTQEKMQAALDADFKDTPLENKKQDFSSTPQGLKWATVSGFSLDKDKRPLYNTEHYLTGKESITVIRIQYNLENKGFADAYKELADSITYRPL